jgi:hypothetical protein
MTETAAQAEHRTRRKQDILERITRALPDWSAERLDVLATQMADLELNCEARDRARS